MLDRRDCIIPLMICFWFECCFEKDDPRLLLIGRGIDWFEFAELLLLLLLPGGPGVYLGVLGLGLVRDRRKLCFCGGVTSLRVTDGRATADLYTGLTDGDGLTGSFDELVELDCGALLDGLFCKRIVLRFEILLLNL